jgi:hypothetical protein
LPEIILSVAGLLRDIASIVVALTGALAFASEIIGLVLKKRPKLSTRILEMGLFGFVFGVLGCFAPLDRGLLFGLVESIICLVAGALLWGVVFVLWRQAAKKQEDKKDKIVAGETVYLGWKASVVTDLILQSDDSHHLRAWWHKVLRDHGKYFCFAFVLVLPGDAEAIRYLTELGSELDQISGEDCLVIALADLGVRRPGFDKELWTAAVEAQTSKGHSLTVAELFDIDLTEFPCLVLFEDVRQPRHIVVSLKGLNVESIGDELRSVFSVIRKAAKEKADPLTAVEESQRRQQLREKGEIIVGQVRSIGDKTFEKAMEAVIKAIIEK